MERVKSWEVITAIGNSNKKRWQALADKYGLEIEQWGIPALAGYNFKSKNHLWCFFVFSGCFEIYIEISLYKCYYHK